LDSAPESVEALAQANKALEAFNSGGVEAVKALVKKNKKKSKKEGKMISKRLRTENQEIR